MPHKKGHKKITKKDMYNPKVLDKLSPDSVMEYLIKFGLLDAYRDFMKRGGVVKKKAPVKSVTYKKGGAVKAPGKMPAALRDKKTNTAKLKRLKSLRNVSGKKGPTANPRRK